MIINIILIGILLWIIFDRFRPVKGLVHLNENELKQKLKNLNNIALIDVRQPYEFKSNHLPNAINLPLPELRKGKAKLPDNKEIILYCQTGIRSSQAAGIVKRKYHLEKVAHLKGGLAAYENLTNQGKRKVKK